MQRNAAYGLFTMSSTFAAGFGDKKRDLLFDLPAFTLWTIDFCLVVFGNALLHGKFTFAVLALVIVSGHKRTSFLSCRVLRLH
jgi:hypothetical protein